MTLEHGSPPEYLVGHIEDALARDPRVNEQGLRVAVVGPGPTVVVTGTAVAPHDEHAIEEVVHELLPGAEVRDETTIADYPEDAVAEEVP